MSKPTLRSLLRWAERNRCYIEICRDGSAEVEFDCDVHTIASVAGHTLYDALLKAKKGGV